MKNTQLPVSRATPRRDSSKRPPGKNGQRAYFTTSPVNEGRKSTNRKKNGVVLKFGTVVGDNVLNNILKVPDRGGLKGAFSFFLNISETMGSRENFSLQK
ncbi:hypothetical protein AVEN_62287-1 [Araneus ventricosus]|uniref:Uncharacterized protein n=1 Tax=Araneus ventricosus TaxID=182803 RepID=A0A4Y2P247_ARAVE|nr:hypothetical protein AVEN_62287-1 [Araneus ventricosus]